MKSEYLENIEKINKCINFSTENKEKLKQLYYYIYNRDIFHVYYKYALGKTFNFYEIDELVFNPSGYYLELNFSRYINQIINPIVLHNKYFTQNVIFKEYHRIDFIKQDSFNSFFKDIDVFKVDKMKDPFNNIKETVISKEGRVLNLDLEE